MSAWGAVFQPTLYQYIITLARVLSLSLSQTVQDTAGQDVLVWQLGVPRNESWAEGRQDGEHFPPS